MVVSLFSYAAWPWNYSITYKMAAEGLATLYNMAGFCGHSLRIMVGFAAWTERTIFLVM